MTCYYPWPLRTDWTNVGLIRPAGACQFSGCQRPRSRQVTFKGRPFDLCQDHADRVEAAA